MLAPATTLDPTHIIYVNVISFLPACLCDLVYGCALVWMISLEPVL